MASDREDEEHVGGIGGEVDDNEDKDPEDDDDDEGGIRAKRGKRDADELEESQADTGDAAEEGPSEELPEDEEEAKAKRAKRAERFGLEAGEAAAAAPKPVPAYTLGIDESLPWSERKRLMVMKKRNGKWGDQAFFAPVLEVGVDPTSEEQQAKAKRRLERFGEVPGSAAQASALALAPAASEEAMAKRAAKFGTSVDAGLAAQARHTLQLLKLKPHLVFRSDPARVDPPELPPPGGPGGGPGGDASGEAAAAAKWVACPTKLHLFCLDVDKAAFKKMRSPEIVNYLKAYQPTYVEWLGDRSCNVHFADAASTNRAFKALFKPLGPPPPPPPKKKKKKKKKPNESGLPKEETAAEAEGAAEDGAGDERAGDAEAGGEEKEAEAEAEGEGEGEAAAEAEEEEEEEEEEPPYKDLSALGWRIGPPLSKPKQDKFGPRGLSARLLGRIACESDVLAEKPTRPPLPRRANKATSGIKLDAPLPSARLPDQTRGGKRSAGAPLARSAEATSGGERGGKRAVVWT